MNKILAVFAFLFLANSAALAVTDTAASCAFVESDYLALNTDAQAAVTQGEFATGYEHYTKVGQAEGRAVNVNCASTESLVAATNCVFSERDYLALNPDVLAAVRRGEYRSGYDHYLRYGRYENRRINYACGYVRGVPRPIPGPIIYPRPLPRNTPRPDRGRRP